MDFYDQISDSYDEMTDLKNRLERIEDFVKALMSRYGPKSVLDAACGTGAYVVKLAQMGIDVTGADISAGMLAKARAQSGRVGVGARWINCPMQQLADHCPEKYDVVMCLGNSIPHILTAGELDQTIKGFAGLLRPGGVLLIHLLNYSRIRQSGQRIVGVTRQGNNEYIRFYDIFPEIINFNLLKITWKGAHSEHQLTSTPLYPYTAQAIRQVIEKHGLGDISLYADYQFNPFDITQSQSLMVEAFVSSTC